MTLPLPGVALHWEMNGDGVLVASRFVGSGGSCVTDEVGFCAFNGDRYFARLKDRNRSLGTFATEAEAREAVVRASRERAA